MNKIEAEFKDLSSLRQMAIQSATVSIGGTIGLFFMPFSLKSGFFIFLGFYYSYIFIRNYISLSGDIKELTQKMEGKL